MSDIDHRAEIETAARRIAPYVRHTPLLTTDLGVNLLVKPESFQVTGAFKARGAVNAVMALRERNPQATGVATVSSGNHAQAVAYAARAAGLHAVIVIPVGASPMKVAATRALGAEIISEGVTGDNREEVVRKVAAERGLPLVHPFDDWDVIHGQATVAREILQDRPSVACIAVPVGGGGLIAGTALAAQAAGGEVRVIGVEPEGAADAADSLRSGEHRRLLGIPATIADGVRSLSLGRRAFDVAVRRRLVHGIVTVTEDEIEVATLVAWRRLHLVIEPTAALPLAAHLGGLLPTGSAHAPTVLVLTGANVDDDLAARLLITPR